MIQELGAYRISGHGGNFTPLAKSLGFNHAYVGAGADAGASDILAAERAIRLKALLKKLAAKGFWITLDLERHSPSLGIKQVLKAAAPVWHRVVRIVLADEAPGLDYEALGYKVVNIADQLDLSSRPMGAVFTPRQIISGEARPSTLGLLDFIGVEAYCDIPLTTGNTDWQVAKFLVEARQATQPIPLVVVAAAYNRNGAFTDPTQIVKVNHVAYDFAEKFGYPLYAFAFGRTGGLKDLPFLQEWYKSRG